MILAVDIGNSQIVLGYMEGLEIRKIARMATDPMRTSCEYAVAIKQIMEFDSIDCHAFEGVIISSVVTPLTETMKEALFLLTGHTALIVGAGIRTGLNIMIDNPAELGSDLVAAGVAAVADYQLPVIIVDMGTATTIEVIDAHANFLGGAIIPGIRLSLEALSNGTSKLPNVPICVPNRCIGTNTFECMQSGSIFGAAALIDGMIDRMEEELGAPATVVATGGLASTIVPHCKREILYDQDLLLRGLAIIYQKNKKQSREK